MYCLRNVFVDLQEFDVLKSSAETCCRNSRQKDWNVVYSDRDNILDALNATKVLRASPLSN